MPRNLKAIGLTLVAMFAMSAFVASAAQAGQFTAGESPAVLTGEQTTHNGETLHLFTAGLRKVQCKTALFEGTSTVPTTTLTIEPTYSNCESAGLPATVTLNGCDYLFNEPEANGADFKGTVNIVCPAGKTIEVHIYSSAANHTAGTSLCTITVEPATKLGSNTYTNVAGSPDHVTVTSEVANIPVKIHGSALICGTATTSTYTGGTTVKAYKDEAKAGEPYRHGAQINATVS